ncbi:MAG: MFS transporter [Chitinophagaceae bacterium]|nr:MFS transporter [Chitinophagaceae bacterium]
MQTASKKVINGWAMYDWANSVYNLVITSTIFPAYYEAVTGDGNPDTMADKVQFLGREFVNTALYNYALAFAMLVVAIISPLLSSIADYRGNKKSFMNFFLTLGSLACAGLFFFTTPTGRTGVLSSQLGLGLGCMIIACVGYWASLVYYNSFLPEIAAPQDRDRISAKGFAYGYVGSVILQLVCFVLVFVPGIVGGDETDNDASTIQFRMCFLLVGIWWWAFGQYSLSRLPKSVPAGTGDLRQHILSKGYKELQKVWRQLGSLKVLKRFLIAFFFYNMGVQTVMLAATLYGKSELQIETTDLIVAILIIQLIAIPGAYIISGLSKRMGNLKALMLCVVVWIFICLIGYYLPVKGKYEFFGLAAIVGFVMGGIQAISRSTYAKLMPETKDTASFFSFYDVTEKIAIVIGMFSFGFINELTGSQRSSVLALMVYFIIGLLLLMYTRSAQRESEQQTGSIPL